MASVNPALKSFILEFTRISCYDFSTYRDIPLKPRRHFHEHIDR